MDWGRAKSVLIVAFLLLNVLLGYQLWTEWRERLNTAADWTSLPPETQQVMRDKNITIKANIPTQTPLMRKLSYSFTQRATKDEHQRITLAPAPETRVVYFEQELNVALGDTIPELSSYRLDQPGSRDGVFVFNRMDGDYPMFNVQLELYYSEQRIRAYSQDLIELKPGEAAKEQQVLPASKAVANLIEFNLPAGSVIREVKLGYYGQIFDGAELQIASPVWRVLLENGEVYYVNAISAEVATEKDDVPVSP
jgi:regulatory protein YycI of two-component signal transduction system YycFG